MALSPEYRNLSLSSDSDDDDMTFLPLKQDDSLSPSALGSLHSPSGITPANTPGTGRTAVPIAHPHLAASNSASSSQPNTTGGSASGTFSGATMITVPGKALPSYSAAIAAAATVAAATTMPPHAAGVVGPAVMGASAVAAPLSASSSSLPGTPPNAVNLDASGLNSSLTPPRAALLQNQTSSSPGSVRDARSPLSPSTKDGVAQQQQPQATNPMTRRNVYISGLPPHFRSCDFREMCQRYGRIEASKLCIDATTTPTKGYGFALFYHEDDAAACIRGLNGSILCGRCLQARHADSSATPQPISEDTASAHPPILRDPLRRGSGSGPARAGGSTGSGSGRAPPPNPYLTGDGSQTFLPPPPMIPVHALAPPPPPFGGAFVPALTSLSPLEHPLQQQQPAPLMLSSVQDSATTPPPGQQAGVGPVSLMSSGLLSPRGMSLESSSHQLMSPMQVQLLPTISASGMPAAATPSGAGAAGPQPLYYMPQPMDFGANPRVMYLPMQAAPGQGGVQQVIMVDPNTGLAYSQQVLSL